VVRLAVVALLALAAAACSGEKTGQTPVLSIEISAAMPFSDPEDAYNALGDTYWLVTPDVIVRLARPCTDVRLAVAARALFNGRPARGWAKAYLGGGGEKASGDRPAGFVLRSHEEAYAGAGGTIEFAARASCMRDGSPVTSTAKRRFDLPSADCADGPLTAFEVGGIATVKPDGEGPAARLEPGDFVQAGSLVTVGRGGRALLGAPECNGFSATLSPGTYWTGSYKVSDRGDNFIGTRIDAVGDDHAGGFSVEGRAMSVEPVGEACRDCSVSVPARYGVRSLGRRVVVRTETGSVRVRGRSGRPVHLRAGQQTTVVCPTADSCKATTPRLFQPNEPWTSPIAGAERPTQRILVTSREKRPSARELAPPRSTVETAVLRATGAVPEQVFVRWKRETRTGAGSKAGSLTSEQGVLLWQADREGRATKWRVVYARRYPWYLTLEYATGDVTRDGHADVLLDALQGSGGCGPWRVAATVAGRTRDIFSRDTCETRMAIEKGALVIDEPVGPCPDPRGSVHCSGGTRHVDKRWNGSRLVTADVSVRCVLPKLDPRRECRPRR
jgi:hypothetical protein